MTNRPAWSVVFPGLSAIAKEVGVDCMFDVGGFVFGGTHLLSKAEVIYFLDTQNYTALVRRSRQLAEAAKEAWFVKEFRRMVVENA